MVGDRQALYQANLHVIEAVIRIVARRYGLLADERRELAGEVHFRLIDNNYQKFRCFEHRSELRTYLVSVVQNLFLDFRNKKWGKWRPSAEAQRLGDVATRLECLACRNGLTFNEAVNVLQINEGVMLSYEELSDLFQRLPLRTPRQFLTEEAVADAPAEGASGEELLLAREQAVAARRARSALCNALLALSTQDRLIVQLHYFDDMTVADIARFLDLKQKRLYRRLADLKQELRRTLEAHGIRASDVLGAKFEADEPENTEEHDEE